MNKDEFINYVKTHGTRKTDIDLSLIDAMKVIRDYFSSIYSEIREEDLAPDTFSTGSNAVLSSVTAYYKDTEIVFLRKQNYIYVNIGPKNALKENVDVLRITSNGLVMSNKYDEDLSEKLLDKYLPMLIKD